MVAASLLQSDDSDVPDLDLPPPRRRNFFHKSTTRSEELSFGRRRFCGKLPAAIFVVAFFVLAYFWYKSHSEIELLRKELREARAEAATMRELRDELHRISLQVELGRDGSRNDSRPATEFVYDRLNRVSNSVDAALHDLRKTSSAVEDVTHRMLRMESKCLAICQVGAPDEANREREREQPRRRQAEKKPPSSSSSSSSSSLSSMSTVISGADEIVFKRTNN